MNIFKLTRNNNPLVIDTVKKPLALITGATSGIGYSFAQLLANKGYDLLLIARDTQRLQQIESDLNTLYQTKVYIYPCDLSKKNCVKGIHHFIENAQINIDVLINNAGFGIHGQFYETDLEKELELIEVQINSVLAISKLCIPYMINKKSGFILNVGSVYSFSPVPYQSVYGACKSFLYSFSTSLSHELKKDGIHVTLLCPGITKTEFRMRSQANSTKKMNKKIIFQGMDPSQVALKGYNALMKGELICIPGLTNRIFVQMASNLPASLFSTALATLNNLRGVNAKNT